MTPVNRIQEKASRTGGLRRPPEGWLEVDQPGRPAPPQALNIPAMLDLGEELDLIWRGRLYKVPPVPARKGLRLQDLQWELQEAERRGATGGEATRVVGELIEEAISQFRELVRPASRWRQLTWRWRRNPFRNASEQEVGELLAFFSLCRTKSNVRHQILGDRTSAPNRT